MKSAASLAVLAGLCTQATGLVLSGPGHAINAGEVDRRNPSPGTGAGAGAGVLTILSEPHSQIRLYHKHPQAISSNNLEQKRAASQALDTVQGGAVLSLSSPSRTNKIKTVSASFIVPRAEIPVEGPTGNNPVGVYAASFWVGIDGAVLPVSPSSSSPSSYGGGGNNGSSEECNPSKSSLRLGVDIFYDGTLGGEQTPFAWYQVLPGLAVGFGNFSVAAGDFVRLTASIPPSSPSPDGTTGVKAAAGGGGGGGGGTVTIENFGPNSTASNSPGNRKNKKKAALQTATHTFPSSADLDNLCQTQAAFIVEDFPLSGLPDFPIALTNFTKVEFGDLKVESTRGESLSLTRKTGRAQVQTLDIHQAPQGGRLTDCAIAGRGSSGKVVCRRVVQP